jgi:hypothetical protein
LRWESIKDKGENRKKEKGIRWKEERLDKRKKIVKSMRLVWFVLLAQVWTRLKIGETHSIQVWSLSVTTFPTDFSFQKVVFCDLFEFLVRKII